MRAPIFRERIHSAVIGRFDLVDIADIVGLSQPAGARPWLARIASMRSCT